MIHFQCEHCRRGVRVADSFGGKQGRCPHCKEVVAIPPADDAIGALAAALSNGSDASEDTAVGPVPPPPPVGRGLLELEEDLLLPRDDADGLDDTVILPAEGAAPPDDDAVAPPGRGRHVAVDSARILSARRTFFLVAAVIVVLAAAAIGFVAIYLW